MVHPLDYSVPLTLDTLGHTKFVASQQVQMALKMEQKPVQVPACADGSQCRWQPVQMAASADGSQCRWQPVQQEAASAGGSQCRWQPVQQEAASAGGSQCRRQPVQMAACAAGGSQCRRQPVQEAASAAETIATETAKLNLGEVSDYDYDPFASDIVADQEEVEGDPEEAEAVRDDK